MSTTTRYTFGDLTHLTRDLSDSRQREVFELQARAVGYVWGWQDAGGSPKDTQASTDFGHAYAAHAARYASETIHYRRPIQDAFRDWSQGLPIES